MIKYVSRLAAGLKPYIPGEQPKDKKYIKLNTNENPYPPSPSALAAAVEAAGDSLRLYPDTDSTPVREAIVTADNLPGTDWVFCANGSDEALAFAFQAFFNPGEPVLMPDISYSFYPVYAEYYHITVKKIPLKDDMTINIEDYMQPSGGIIIANPNAPTGAYLDVTDIERLVAASDCPVIIDEAYIDFGGVSAAPLVNLYPNLIIIRTLSKSHALAGLRLGYCIAQPEMIAALRAVRDCFNSYPVDYIAQATAAAAITDTVYYKEINARVAATRDRTADTLRSLGFTVVPSLTNFIFVSPHAGTASALFAYLRENGVLVRHFALPRIDNYLRISIGTDVDMDTVIRHMTAWLQA